MKVLHHTILENEELMSKVNGSIFVTEEYTYLFYLVALNKTHD